jgi:NADH:ubiquinone oxidoreductase subunit 5 (subunit L)/multisubunit Na+/H+ antiporter MnhA subunit
MVVGGVLALCRFDCKEIVAFSTLRQIGFIIFTLSIGLKKLAFFHLITHALFKSVLFMVRGALIHIYHSQDIRLLGLKKIPFTLSLPFLISLISMRGLPFLSGFYSKDAILDSIIFFSSGWVIDLVAILIIGLSSLYSFRILSFILLNKIFPSF